MKVIQSDFELFEQMYKIYLLAVLFNLLLGIHLIVKQFREKRRG